MVEIIRELDPDIIRQKVSTERKKAHLTQEGSAVIVVSKEFSAWKSAAIISHNLFKAYTTYFKSQVVFLNEPLSKGGGELLELAQSIHSTRPKKIILIDDVLPAYQFLSALFITYRSEPLPPIYVHVYGSFTLWTKSWLAIESVLKKTSIHFLCASERQAELLGRFLIQGRDCVSVCPFPVEVNDYFFSPALRCEYRGKLESEFGVQTDDVLLLFTGRLSVQKNITRLIQEVDSLIKSNQGKFQLLLVGNFDDKGIPLFSGNDRKFGSYYQQWLKSIESLEPWVRSRIHYLSHQNTADLNGLYNAADIFVSLSLYHDEDFGMSPAEALCCGLPTVLTDWGGYSDFEHVSKLEGTKSCIFTEVQLTSEGLVLSSESFKRAVLTQADSFSSRKRSRLSQAAKNRYSVHAVASRIKIIHALKSPPFLGFSRLMRSHAKAMSIGIPYPQGPRKWDLYEKIYGAYLSKS